MEISILHTLCFPWQLEPPKGHVRHRSKSRVIPPTATTFFAINPISQSGFVLLTTNILELDLVSGHCIREFVIPDAIIIKPKFIDVCTTQEACSFVVVTGEMGLENSPYKPKFQKILVFFLN